MEENLIQLGLSSKEAGFYVFLLGEGALTAAQIAKGMRESRTNTYMVLEKLADEGLIESDNTTPIRRYKASDPALLRARVSVQLQKVKRSQAILNAALPGLSSLFTLSQHKPGVLYLEGLKGFKFLLEDNARITEGTIDLIASDLALSNKDAWEILQKGIAKRQARDIRTRGLFHAPESKWPEIKKFESKGYEVKKWGNQPLPGEIVIYGSKIAFTVYQPELIVTIMTSSVMAQTFRALFEQLWQDAR